jgi:hypothetical protein
LLFHPDRRQTLKLKSFIEMVVEQLGCGEVAGDGKKA